MADEPSMNSGPGGQDCASSVPRLKLSNKATLEAIRAGHITAFPTTTGLTNISQNRAICCGANLDVPTDPTCSGQILRDHNQVERCQMSDAGRRAAQMFWQAPARQRT